MGLIKKVVFELNALISRKRKEIRPKLLLMSNRMLYIMHFPLASRSMTLDDLELLSSNFPRISRDFAEIWEATSAKQIKILVLSAKALYLFPL